jgi:uncharacterized protein (UPF0332 family)
MGPGSTVRNASVLSAAEHRKRAALELFTGRILSSPVGRHVAKVIVFGSVPEHRSTPESDVDVIILAGSQLQRVEDAAADAAFDVGMISGESVEPLIYPLNELRYPSSYFVHRSLLHGEEVYSMDDVALKAEECRGYRDLAAEYLDGAKDALKQAHSRLAVDAAYNAAELCAKGLLLFELKDLPTSHGGVVVKFAQCFVKEGPLPRSLGKSFSKALLWRNKSRYDRAAMIGSDEAQEAIKLAEEMIRVVDQRLGDVENRD